MNVQQLEVKVFVEGAKPDGDALTRVFHRWIQEQQPSDLLIDVTDYSHVHHGPGVMLIAHEAHYAMDEAEGRAGLLYSRKRGPALAFAELVDQTFERALSAAKRLEGDSLLSGLKFRSDEYLFRIQNRLHAPNSDSTLEAVRGELERVGKKLLGRAPKLERTDRDPRAPFSVKIS